MEISVKIVNMRWQFDCHYKQINCIAQFYAHTPSQPILPKYDWNTLSVHLLIYLNVF